VPVSQDEADLVKRECAQGKKRRSAQGPPCTSHPVGS
jgi:hypothetical protein